MKEPEFLRSNQKSYLRIACDNTIMQSYEFQMCSYNTISSFLSFQKRNQNGQEYLYFDVSSAQSLDIYLQTRKLKREAMVKIAKSILKLCNELEEYALKIECVNFIPKYIMVSSEGDNIHFIYLFGDIAEKYTGLEELLECCIDNLDYKDDLLTERLYQIYESFLEQKDTFFLAGEMEHLLNVLPEEKIERKSEESPIEPEHIKAVDVEIPQKSHIAQKDTKRLRRGVLGLLVLDILLFLGWKPLTILKIFFCSALAIVLVLLILFLKKQDKQRINYQEEEIQNDAYMKEYMYLSEQAESDDNATQIITAGDREGVLYNLQKSEPPYIYINGEGKIIGKDLEKAQVHIAQESISRIHAFVIKEDSTCFVEDLNSTNGTTLNGEVLKPRTRYALKQGDKICFADMEYIFR